MNGCDGMNYFDKQIENAKNNYNYFFIKLLFCVLKIIFKLSIVLIISGIFDFIVINIMTICFTFYSLYEIYRLCTYYTNIINDIKKTLEINFILEIDFTKIGNIFFGGLVKYGK